MIFPDDWLHIKNWEKFQYRTDKKLPWIKLECGLLQDRDFLKFDRATQRDLIAIWLLARNQSHPGWIPSDSKVVSKLIQGGRNLDLQVFINAGFLEKKCALEEKRIEERRGEEKKAHSRPKVIPIKPPEIPTEIPSWIPADEWQGYVEMRLKIRKPMTDRAIKMAIRILSELKAQGHEPIAVLNQSIFNSWQSLYPIKTGGNGNGRLKGSELEENNKRAFAEAIRRAAERDKQQARGVGIGNG